LVVFEAFFDLCTLPVDVAAGVFAAGAAGAVAAGAVDCAIKAAADNTEVKIKRLIFVSPCAGCFFFLTHEPIMRPHSEIDDHPRMGYRATNFRDRRRAILNE